jgi:Lar family restriction alleviation protein
VSEEIHPDDPRFVLRPCPFCGSSNISKARRIDYPVWTQCLSCDACGPLKLTGREADAAWNVRKEAKPAPTPSRTAECGRCKGSGVKMRGVFIDGDCPCCEGLGFKEATP